MLISAKTDPKYVKWSRAVIDMLIDKLGVPNGDAQGIFEAREDEARRLFLDGKPSEYAGGVLLGNQ